MTSFVRSLSINSMMFALIFAVSLSASRANAQMPGGQNGPQDIVNSLTPATPKIGKGEKKTEVDPKTLESHTFKDARFDGSMLDTDLPSSNGKKPSAEKTAKDAAGTAKHEKAAQSSDAGEAVKRDQNQKSPRSEEKSSATSGDKSGATKPDGR